MKDLTLNDVKCLANAFMNWVAFLMQAAVSVAEISPLHFG